MKLKDLLEHSVGMLEHLARIFVSCFQTSAFDIRRLVKNGNLRIRHSKVGQETWKLGGTHEPF